MTVRFQIVLVLSSLVFFLLAVTVNGTLEILTATAESQHLEARVVPLSQGEEDEVLDVSQLPATNVCVQTEDSANDEACQPKDLEHSLPKIASSDFDVSSVQRKTVEENSVRDSAIAATSVCDVESWQSGKGSAALPISLTGSCLEEYWHNLPSLYQVTEGKVIMSFDGYSFTERMSLYKFMIFELDDSTVWGQNATLREYHWLWAYAAQLDWQKRSGRLSEFLTAPPSREQTDELSSAAAAVDSDRISLDSWWGYMNFCFSVAIFRAFENAGLLSKAFGGKEVIVQMDKVSQALVDHDQFVDKCVRAWETLLKNGYTDYVNQVATAGSSGEHSSAYLLTDRDFQEKRFQLQKEAWKAHTAVILNGDESETFHELLAKMPPVEQGFGRGWAKMVEMLAACSFPTDLITLQQDGAGFLPTQVLTDAVWSDMQQQKNELSAIERKRFRTVKSTESLLSMSPSSMKHIIAFWKRIVQSASTSRSTPGIIKDLYHGSILAKAQQITRLLLLYVRPG